MRIDSFNKKIAILIVIFPPVILIIYAIVAYFIFYSSDKTSTNTILQHYKQEMRVNSLNVLKTKVYTVDNFLTISSSNLKNILQFLKSIKVQDNAHIAILKKDNTLLYSTQEKSKVPLNILSKISNSYEDNNYIALLKYNKSTNFKIVVFISKDRLEKNIAKVKKDLENTSHSSFIGAIFWLVLVWFVLLFVSLWISTSVYKRLKSYEKSIRESNKDIIFQSRQAMLGELLPMIAHQWRQPLNKISSVLMFMRFEIMSGKTNTQTLDRQSQLIEDSVELMSQIIEDFRTFYRPKEEPQEADIAVLVRKASYFLDELLKRKKIALNQDLTSVTLKIHANEFLQVIINLIKNASDAVAVRGEINILLREFSDGRVELRIEDNGTGIPKDKLEKIFEAHESSKQASMGLGLYMSKLIIEDHFGGKIQAYNTPRGAGFLIVLYKGGGK